MAEQRYQAVLAVIEDGLSVTDVAAKVGVSRQTVHTWLSRYAGAGLPGLEDRSHRVVSCPHRMAPQVEARIVELRQLHPGWGAERLVYRLGREGWDPVPSVAAVGRALRRAGLTSGTRRAGAREYRRWERGAAMELWQIDVMGDVRLDDGTELKAVTGIDDHSRFCVMVGLVERATSRPVCAVFAQALRTYGVPEEVLTDNGKVFTGRFGFGARDGRPVEVLFDRICRENGITHRLTAPRSPTTTGKIERFHGTLRRELLNGVTFPSKAAAKAAVDAWVVEYNTDRPHQSLGRATPAQRFHGPSAIRVDTVTTGPELRVTSMAPDRADGRGGQDWVTRRVASNGIISVAYQQVSVGKHRGGETVEVHVTDRLLEVWSGNDLLRTLPRESTGTVRKRRATKTAWTHNP